MDVLCICFICLNLIVSSVMGLWWWVFLMFVKRDQLHNSNHYFRWCVWDIMVWQLHTSLIWSFAISRPAWANSFDGMSGFDPVHQCGGYSDVFTFISFYLFFLEPLSIGAKIDEYTLGSLDRFFFLTELIFPLAMINHPLLERYVYFCHREMSSVAINLTCVPIINLDFWQLINLFLRNYWGGCLLRLY